MNLPHMSKLVYIKAEILTLNGQFTKLGLGQILKEWTNLKILNIRNTNIQCDASVSNNFPKLLIDCFQDPERVGHTVGDETTINTNGMQTGILLDNKTIQSVTSPITKPTAEVNSTMIDTRGDKITPNHNVIWIGAVTGGGVGLVMIIAALTIYIVRMQRRYNIRRPIYRGIPMTSFGRSESATSF